MWRESEALRDLIANWFILTPSVRSTIIGMAVACQA